MFCSSSFSLYRFSCWFKNSSRNYQILDFPTEDIPLLKFPSRISLYNLIHIPAEQPGLLPSPCRSSSGWRKRDIRESWKYLPTMENSQNSMQNFCSTHHWLFDLRSIRFGLFDWYRKKNNFFYLIMNQFFEFSRHSFKWHRIMPMAIVQK